MKQFVALMGVVFLIGGCGRVPRHSIDIADVTKPTTLTLAPPPGKSGPINYLTLQIRDALTAAPRYRSLSRLPTGLARDSPSSGPAIMGAPTALFVMFHDRSHLERSPSNTPSIRMLFAG